MLTGQAKTDYQREYMRRYRANNVDSALSGSKAVSKNAPECPVVDERNTVRPKASPVRPVRPKASLVRPKGLSANQWAYIQSRADDGQI